jgi:hypothetical protein
MSRYCLCTFSRRGNKDIELRMEEEREEGQALLRAMVTASDTVDWRAIIQKAEELHHREQDCLRQQDSRERRLFLQRQRCALQKRRKYDSIGSFSINLLTYRTEPAYMDFSKQSKSVASSMGSTKGDEEASLDSHSLPLSPPDFVISPSSSSSMGVIDDQLEAVDSGSV